MTADRLMYIRTHVSGANVSVACHQIQLKLQIDVRGQFTLSF